jgi:hypothetical protein
LCKKMPSFARTCRDFAKEIPVFVTKGVCESFLRRKGGKDMNKRWVYLFASVCCLTALAACKTDHADKGVAVKTAAGGPAKQVQQTLTPATALERASQEIQKSRGFELSLKGQESLTAKQKGAVHKIGADFRATAQVTIQPRAFHSKGAILSKGKKQSEEIYVIGEDVYRKAGTTRWTKDKLDSWKSQLEDPLAALAALQQTMRAQGQDVSVKTEQEHVAVTAFWQGVKYKQTETVVLKNAEAELKPTLEQLKKLGYHVNTKSIRLKSYKETWILDAKTFLPKQRILEIVYTMTAGNTSFTYDQKLETDVKGEFNGEIIGPAEVKKSTKTGKADQKKADQKKVDQKKADQKA